MKQVVLGAGPLGASLARLLRADGHAVDIFAVMGNPAYDMLGTTPDAIDGANVEEVSTACEGAEIIYLCLNAHYVDWFELFPPRLDAAMDAAAGVGARILYHDNVYMYRPGPDALTEATPYDAATRKGQLRASLATRFLNTVRSGRIRGAIGRSADMYGPGALNSSFNSTLGERHFYPLLAGKAVSIVGDIDQPHTYAFVDDVARGLMTLAERTEADGQAWHLPAAPTLTHRELMTLAFDVAGRPVKLRGSKVSGYVVRVIGRFQRDVGEVAEILDQFEKPLVVSHESFDAAFGADPTPHRVALEQTLAWYRANPPS